MKSHTIRKTLEACLVSTVLIAATNIVHADPPEAEDKAHRVAVQYRDRGFYVQPIEANLLMRGEMVRVQIPVVRGLDYVIIAAGDLAATDIDAYVYSEVDTLIINDDLARDTAIVQFRAQYTGSVYAYIFMARTNPNNGLPSYAAFVGRRGTARTPDAGSGGAGKVAPSSVTNSPSGNNNPVKK